LVMPLKSLRAQVIVLLVVTLVIYALIASYVTISILRSCAEETAVDKAKGDLALAEALIDALYPGPWEVEGDRLYKGGVLMNENPIVNRITRLTGDTCTIFLRDVQIATTVPGPSGKPAIGTRVPAPVRRTVLDEGRDYLGPANVVGQPYQTAYRPLKNARGEVIGILYVGTPQTQIRRMVQKLMLSKVVVLLSVLSFFGFFMSTVFTRWFSPLRNISSTLKAIARGDYDRALEPPRYTEFEGIAEAVERMRLDVKETVNRLNNLSNFGMRAVSLVKEEEAYRLLIHYLKRLGVDEALAVLIDETHRRGRVAAYYSRPAQKEEYFSEPVCRFSFSFPVLKEIELCQAVRVLSPYVVDNVSDDLGCRFGCITDSEIKSYVCYPLAVGGRALGWVKTASRTPNFFKPETKKEIEGYVSLTAAMIANLRLSELNRYLSLTDPLTTLYNRRFFTEYFERLVAEANRRREPFSVIFLDIDQFKNINDTYGHEVGDKVLATSARTIKESLRETDLMIRYGGEEFVIVLPGTNLKGGVTVAEKIRRTIATTPVFLESGESLFLTVSMGVAEYKLGTGQTCEEVIQRADEAMYQAKLKGKNLVVAYEEDSEGRPVFRSEANGTAGSS